MKKLFAMVAAVAAMCASQVRADIIISNAGFESPVTDLSYSPSIAQQGGSGWVFENYFAGIASNVFLNEPAPEGNQVGVIQQWSGQTALSGFGQEITGFSNGSYAVSFYAAGRQGYGANPFIVEIDGTVLKFGGVSAITPTELPNGFHYYTSDAITLSGSTHYLKFESAGLSGGDVMSFIDAVSVTAVPEPSGLMSFSLGSLVCAGYAWRRLHSPGA